MPIRSPRVSMVRVLPLLVTCACSSASSEPPPTAAPVQVPEADAGVEASNVEPDVTVSADGTYDLAGLDASLPEDDLAPLGRVTKNATVVALGESIHTSGGFYRAKVRIIEYLIAKQGVRVVAFESPWENADSADNFVQTGTGTADDATRKLHTIWWDESVSALFTFMRKWNEEHPADLVHFTGFDIRQPWLDGPALRTFFTAHAPAKADALMNGISGCLGMGYSDERAFFHDPNVMAIFQGTAEMPADKHAQCLTGVDAAMSELDAEKAGTPKAEWDIAHMRLGSIRGFDDSIFNLATDPPKAQGARDAVMYEVFSTLRGQRWPGAKVAVWAHNLHITRNNPGIQQASYPGTVTFGTLVDRELGASYAPIGLVGYAVGIDWQTGPATIMFDSKGSIELALHTAKKTLTFVDLVTSVDTPFVAAGNTMLVSAEKMVPSEHYAGLVFIDKPEGAKYIGGVSPFSQAP